MRYEVGPRRIMAGLRLLGAAATFATSMACSNPVKTEPQCPGSREEASRMFGGNLQYWSEPYFDFTSHNLSGNISALIYYTSIYSNGPGVSFRVPKDMLVTTGAGSGPKWLPGDEIDEQSYLQLYCIKPETSPYAPPEIPCPDVPADAAAVFGGDEKDWRETPRFALGRGIQEWSYDNRIHPIRFVTPQNMFVDETRRDSYRVNLPGYVATSSETEGFQVTCLPRPRDWKAGF